MKSVKRKLSAHFNLEPKPQDYVEFTELITHIKCRLASNNLEIGSIPTAELYKNYHQQLIQMVTKSVTEGESNSILIIGPRGSGKSALLRSALKEVIADVDIRPNLEIVSLNALVQTDDSIALRDIARQMQLPNVVDEKVTGSFAENMSLLMQTFSSGEIKKSIVFCLEEFDLFCQHRKQNLLYNLLDTAQASDTTIVVIGVTCRLDVIELLEKRVKSRFSHRQINLFNELSFEDYRDTAVYWLKADEDFPNYVLQTQWNNSIKTLFTENKIVTEKLSFLYELTKDFRVLKQLLWPALGMLSTDGDKSRMLEETDVVGAFDLLNLDSKQFILKGLSTLELTLVLIMARISQQFDGESFNFNNIYGRYKKICKDGAVNGLVLTGLQQFSKPVVTKSFEHLQQLELVQGSEGGQAYKGQKEYQPLKLLVELTDLFDIVRKCSTFPTHITQLTSALFENF